jgi:hypothetical protein
VFDRTESGTAPKWLSIVDEYTRECLCLKVNRSITSEDVLGTFSELFAMQGAPQRGSFLPRRSDAPGGVADGAGLQTLFGRDRCLLHGT